ncbi:hypothetical protein [Mesorhizobium sp.]|uniref:hypothetical protein n=1 Tax=Mesorhizobium sp. TaxID=1871066 RepID=UPI000FE78E50|nr:hypothetical protein [Mesorhizobium sp.]RWO87086.1 MAG: hypothetical protein EOQ95_21195 [Mesorhizobium sp.]
MIEGASVPTAKLTEAAGAGINPSLYRAAFPYVSGDTLEHIVEAKADERGTVQLINTSAGAAYNATLNLLEGTVIASGGASLISAVATALGVGWYKFKVTAQITATGPGNAQCRISPAAYTGDGVSGIYVRKHVMQKQGTTVNLFPSSDPTSLTFTRQNLADVINTATPEALVVPALEDTANRLDVLINGRLTATKLVQPVGSGSPAFWQPRTGLVIGDDVEIEVIAKRDERLRLNLFSNSGARYDVTANLEVGSVAINSTFPLPATASIAPLGGGWYKIKINQEAVVAGGMNPQHRIFSATGAHPYVGDGVSGLHVQSSTIRINGGPNLNLFRKTFRFCRGRTAQAQQLSLMTGYTWVSCPTRPASAGTRMMTAWLLLLTKNGQRLAQASRSAPTMRLYSPDRRG